MSEKLKVLDDLWKKAYKDTVDENERLTQANQKLDLQLEIAKTSAQKEKEANTRKQKLIQEMETKYTALAVENTELKDGIEKYKLENQSLQDKNDTLKTSNTQLTFQLNETECSLRSKEEEEKKSLEEVSNLTLEKKSLIDKVVSLEETISRNKEKDEKCGKQFEKLILKGFDVELKNKVYYQNLTVFN